MYVHNPLKYVYKTQYDTRWCQNERSKERLRKLRYLLTHNNPWP